MTTQNQVQPYPQTLTRVCDPISPNRAVLYADDPRENLLRCSRDARHQGDRIVSAASEGEDRRSGRQALYALIERMLQGEFDTIVAAVTSNARGLRAWSGSPVWTRTNEHAWWPFCREDRSCR